MQTSPRSVEEPAHVRAAPAHPNPYPFYARLAREEPVFRDERNDCWVVASAAAVREVLESSACYTRPVTERVPRGLGGGATAALFGRLVRLTDGEAHDRLKRPIVSALARLDLERAADLARARAQELERELGDDVDESWVTEFAFALPVQALARLLGIQDERLADVIVWLRAYGAAAASAATGVPAPSPALLEEGDRGAAALLDLMGKLADSPASQGPLLASLIEEGRAAGCSREQIVANSVGLLIQGFAAVASLIGLTLLALARDPKLLGDVEADRSLLRALVQEVVRCDPTTNSTIRFLARDTVIAGQPMREGDRVIVLIAAANRDPALNEDPDRFDIHRANRQYLEFGAGAHACPAHRLAPLLAEVAIDHLLTLGAPIERLPNSVGYAPSAHIRTPLFVKEKQPAS